MFVDVVVGPALTGIIASPRKSHDELKRDVAIIVLLQIFAFSYGIYSLAVARPVGLVFEVDMMRVITAADVDTSALAEAPLNLRSLPWNGPRLMAAVKPTERAALFRAVELGFAGVPLASLPSSWREYAPYQNEVWKKSKPVAVLIAKYPGVREELAAMAAGSRQQPAELRFLPLISRQSSWVALVAAPDSRVVGFLPVDGYF